jgi:CheY-like chemotaxis protein
MPGRSSPDSGTPNEEEKITIKACPSQSTNEFACWSSLEDGKPEPTQIKRFSFSTEPSQCENSEKGSSFSSKRVKDLEGLRILLAEDTPVLQRVATIMLEKMGATVIAVGDGLQAVEILNCRPETLLQNGNPNSTVEIRNLPPIDLVLMDCQMPKMDGYEATKTIRKSEARTNLHIPIVALTAHAMSSDEAKCLEVGMDAYLTKPIDFKLMVSTILSLTRKASSN